LWLTSGLIADKNFDGWRQRAGDRLGGADASVGNDVRRSVAESMLGSERQSLMTLTFAQNAYAMTWPIQVHALVAQRIEHLTTDRCSIHTVLTYENTFEDIRQGFWNFIKRVIYLIENVGSGPNRKFGTPTGQHRTNNTNRRSGMSG
jgi:hypothetical protein